MNENVTDVKDWNTAESWVAELIEQAKANSKRWFVAWIITIIALIGTNAAWIYVLQSYEYVSQDGDGINNVNSGTQGDLTNGAEGEN